jgi:hypothetical protein
MDLKQEILAVGQKLARCAELAAEFTYVCDRQHFRPPVRLGARFKHGYGSAETRAILREDCQMPASFKTVVLQVWQVSARVPMPKLREGHLE